MINHTNTYRSGKRANNLLLLAIATLIIGFMSMSELKSATLYSAVQVSDVTGPHNIGQANTSRNLAIGNNGDIYAVFSGSQGIRVAKSTNRGSSFQASVQVSTMSGEAEIELTDNGTIYVAWISGIQIYFSKSTDGGSTFSTPSVIATGANGGVHMDSYGSYVYVLQQNGSDLRVNNNYGTGAFTTVNINGSQVFSDVMVNPTNGDVFVTTDNPNLRHHKSTNNGSTFTQITVSPSSNIYYSSYTLSVGSLGTNIFVSGSGTDAYKLDANTGASTSLTFGNNTSSMGRTLDSDELGNLIDGYSNFGSSVSYRTSWDQGSNWQTAVSIANATSHNVKINPETHDIVVLYSSAGGIFLNVYNNELKIPLKVTTNLTALNITCNSARLRGRVQNFGAATVDERGFVYSTSGTPTISDSKEVVGSGAGRFARNIDNLCPGTTYYFRAYATDSDGNTYYGSTGSFTTSSPTFSLSLSPNELWPPNHNLSTIEATISSDMNCTGLSYELTSITSNEDDNGLGDGDRPDDIQNAATGTEDYEFSLRAERSGTGDGRIYTVTYTITDACGTEYTASAEVTVPKSKGKNKETFNNLISENSISLYPNPTTNNINLDMNFIYKANATVTISDITGRMINTFERNNVDAIQEQIDVANLLPGNYIISVKFGEESFVRRFVKY